MTTSNCFHSNIFTLPIQERCAFVKDNCPYEYVNFYEMHFCFFNGNYLLTIPTSIFLMIIFFFILAETSEMNLSSSLTNLVNKLGISQNIAAVTLLALGNGAADVISSLVASTQNEGIELAVGSLLGSCSFVTSCAFGIIIYSSGEIKSNPQAINRDIGLFIFSLGFFLYVYIRGSITIYHSITFFGLYILNIIMALYQDWESKKKRIDKKDTLKQISNKNIIQKKESISFRKNIINSEVRTELGLEFENSYKVVFHNFDNFSLCHSEDTNINSNNNSNNSNDSNCYTEKENNNLMQYYKHDNGEKDTIINIQIKNTEIEEQPLNPFELIFAKFKRYYLHHKEKNWESIRLITKIFYLLFDFPFAYLRSLTIPPCDFKHWNKSKFILMPLCDLIFIAIVFKLYRNMGSNLWIYCGFISFTLIIAFLLSILTKPKVMPNNIILISICAFAMSLVWIWFIANNLISLLKLLGLLLGFIDSFLGMTLLTFGNSICDIALNIALVKNGYHEMALTGALAGPLFNFLIGLGSTMIKQNLTHGVIVIDAYNVDSVIIIISIICMMINLGRIAIQAKIYKYRLNTMVAYIGWMIYGSFLIIIFYITFRA